MLNELACVIYVVFDFSFLLLQTQTSTPSFRQLPANDCEGLDLSRFGTVSLVQLATRDGTCWLFDVLVDHRGQCRDVPGP